MARGGRKNYMKEGISVKTLAGMIDHTNLKAYAMEEDFLKLCNEALEYGFAMVAINPYPVSFCKSILKGSDVHVGAAIAFPLGQTDIESKVAETKQAILDGADEIDTVINISDVKNGRFDSVLDELKLLKKIAGEHVLKVIIETCYLTEEEKIKLCGIVTEAGADYIKTSTGFGSAGADITDIRLFRENIGASVKIKAAGGIRTVEEAELFVKAGADRIGSSAVIPLLLK